MTSEDRNEIKEIMHDILAGHQARQESAYTTISYKLDQIELQTSKTNGRVTRLEDSVKDLQVNEQLHFTKCPIAPKVEVMQKDIDNVKNIKKFVVGAIGVTAVIVTIIVEVFKVIH